MDINYLIRKVDALKHGNNKKDIDILKDDSLTLNYNGFVIVLGEYTTYPEFINVYFMGIGVNMFFKTKAIGKCGGILIENPPSTDYSCSTLRSLDIYAEDDVKYGFEAIAEVLPLDSFIRGKVEKVLSALYYLFIYMPYIKGYWKGETDE